MKKIVLGIVIMFSLFIYFLRSNVWINPTESICMQNGGRLFKKGVCDADLENAEVICQEMDARLPTIDELSKAIINCGGIVDSETNEGNYSYQSCYKKKGFVSDNDFYWSSTVSLDSSYYLNIMNFNYGYNYTEHEQFSYHVRCIKYNLLQEYLYFDQQRL